MVFRWLKRYLPQSLYGRAALILLLPVLTLQILVAVIFFQRHFDRVTQHMTLAIARELALVLQEIDKAPQPALILPRTKALTEALDIRLTLAEPPFPPQSRRWYDLSGRVVIRTLRAELPHPMRIQLPDNDAVHLWVTTANGSIRLTFDRARVSPSNPHQLLVYMVVFGFLITAIAYVYLRNQLRPITRLARAARAFGEGRRLPYRVAGSREVRAAGTAFLEMRRRIEHHLEQRAMMLLGVSHDLRTPLTRLRLGVSLLPVSEQERAPIEKDIADMQRLLDEFVNFVQGAQGGAAGGDWEDVDPIALVRESIAAFARGGAAVVLVACEGAGQMPLRRVGLRRAVENVIENAVRYGGRVEVSLRLDAKALRIRVEDDGPGIPAGARAEAIKPFVRLDPARNQDKGSGVGLGLAIAADTVRAHGGALHLGTSPTLGGLCADIVIARPPKPYAAPQSS
ncbi:MAG: HAMP domain-containing protein [Rhodobacteraceae bacterium]|nr:HAMP domain-containing protein [Paracoccaceae bacterium]